MTADPFVNHVPTMMGGVGAGAVADFYDKYFIGHWRADTTSIPVCRAVGTDRVVDEMIIRSNMTSRCPRSYLEWRPPVVLS